MKKKVSFIFFDLGQTLIELTGLSTAMSQSLSTHLPKIRQNLKKITYSWVIETHTLFLEYKKKEFLPLKDIHFYSLRNVLQKISLDVADTVLKKIVEDSWSLFVKHSVLHHDVISVLNMLKNEGYNLGIITDSDADVAYEMLRKHNLKEYFKVMVISGETKRYKPDREVFIEAIRLAGCSATKAVYVGDSEFDIQGAKEVGMITVVIQRNELHDPAVPLKPDIYLPNLYDLPKFITNWNSN